MSDATPAVTIDRSGLKLGPLWMVPGVTGKHVATLYFGAFFGIAMMSFVGVSQPYIFTEILQIPFEEQGTLSGRLVIVQELVILLLIGPIGAASDKFGRKSLWVPAFLFYAVGYTIYPLASSPQELMMYRTVFACGAACNAAMLVAIANDYTQEPCRAKMIAFTFIFNGLGLALLPRPLASLPEYFTAQGVDPVSAGRYAYWCLAAMCALVAIVVAVGIKPGAPAQLTKRDPFLATAKVAVRAARNPRVSLAYIAAMVSRGDLAVVSSFFTLWLIQEGVSRGMPTAEALKRATLFYVIIQALALPWAPIAGFVLDRIDRVLGLAIAMGVAAVGYSSLALVDDPLGRQMYIAAALVGLGEITANLSAISLIGAAAPERGRGAVIGAFSFFGALGILMVGLIGGWLFDNWKPIGPFMLVAGANCALLVLAVLVLVFTKAPVPSDEQEPQVSAPDQ